MNIIKAISDKTAPPPIIAELSGNHNNKIEIAKSVIKALSKAGGSFLKIQTYTPDSLTLNCEKEHFIVRTPNNNWNGRTLYSLYTEAALPMEWHEEILQYANSFNISVFSSIFATKDLDFCENLGISAYKIASQECIHYELLKEVASTNKPIILSTGMASIGEIEDALNVINSNGKSEVVLMKCTSSYPADPRDTNILSIPLLRQLFDLPVGFSDHTTGIGTAIAAISHGARCVEKHICCSTENTGIDGDFSVNEFVFEQLILETKNAFNSLGTPTFEATKSELPYFSGRRSVFATKDIMVGQKLTRENTAVIRPNTGLHPKFYETVLGMQTVTNVEKGTPINWSIVK